MPENKLLIKKAAFATSATKKAADSANKEGFPEIAVAGKSNVGKSSLINYLCNHSKLAYVSKQPGKTRLINYFLINDQFYLVDLPGYGFARVSKSEKSSWGSMMDDYFSSADKLAALIVLMDIRHKPTQEDIEMVKYAKYYGIPFAVVATKADKIAKSKRIYSIRELKKHIQVETGTANDFSVLHVSALEKRGKEDILGYIQKQLEEKRG